MSLIQDIKNDLRDAKKIRIPWWGLLCWMAICGLIEWLLIELGRFDLGLPVLNSVAVVGFAIVLKRKQANHAWFWITMLFLAALHIPLVLFTPWTSKWVPSLAIAAIDTADLIVILAILNMIKGFSVDPETNQK